MEKLDLQEFRALKQEILNFEEKQNSDEYIYDEEEEERFFERYKEIIKILSEHDLSDIDFEEWRGMTLIVNKENPIDFSKTNANLDFSIIKYSSEFNDFDNLPNFKNCKIKNFDFEQYQYIPKMFDENFIKENDSHFLSNSVSEDIAYKFYRGEISLTDIVKNPEVARKISISNIEYKIRPFYTKLGREELCKLDCQFIEFPKDSYFSYWYKFIESRSDINTAKEVMQVLYQFARDGFLKNEYRFDQRKLGEEFKRRNPDLFLSDDAPEEVKEAYYKKELEISQILSALPYLKNKKISHAILPGSNSKIFFDLFGDGSEVYSILSKYGNYIVDVLNNYNTIREMETLSEGITDGNVKEMFSKILLFYLKNKNGYIQSLDELKMYLDFIPLEDLPINKKIKDFTNKYGIETLISSEIDLDLLKGIKSLTNLDEIKRLNEKISMEDLNLFIKERHRIVLEKYGLDSLLEAGFTDISEISNVILDLNQYKKLSTIINNDLINMGIYSDEKKAFIAKYGIDNIIALDEESNGMFSHVIKKDNMGHDDIYLTIFALAELRTSNFEITSNLTYDQFKDQVVELLNFARESIIEHYDFPNYDFISR